MQQATAKLRYLRIAPRKVRLVAGLLRGMRASEAEAQLMLMRKRAALPVLKLLRSALANAKNKNLKVNTLVVTEARVDQASMLKRFLPRAKGMATPIHKIASHVIITLAESGKEETPRFVVIPKEKKVLRQAPASAKAAAGKQGKKSKPAPHPKPEAKTEKKATEEPGIFKKIFRRKAIA